MTADEAAVAVNDSFQEVVSFWSGGSCFTTTAMCPCIPSVCPTDMYIMTCLQS